MAKEWLWVIAGLGIGACGDERRARDPDAAVLDANPDDAVTIDALPSADAEPEPGAPTGGELVWHISAPGAGDPVSIAVGDGGSVYVVATQTGAVAIGNVQLPAPPPATEALLVLKLGNDGTPLWGRTFTGPREITARGIAATRGGGAVIGGMFAGAPPSFGTGFTASAADDGFVVALDATGTVRWATQLASASSDHVAAVAAGAGPDEVYLYGRMGREVVIGGQRFPVGAYLIRASDDGAWRWIRTFEQVEPGYQHGLALAPAGPVIGGQFFRMLTLDDHELRVDDPDNDEDGFVAAFDGGGAVRYAHQIFEHFSPFWRAVAAAPDGSVALASRGQFEPTVVDGRPIWTSDGDDTFVLRLTPQGRHAAHAVIAGRLGSAPGGLAIDATGASYTLASCFDRVFVQPEIPCDRQGGVLVSHDADQVFRWATYVGPAFLQGVAPGLGGRVIVAGQALGDQLEVGGKTVPSQQLFVAAIASGAVRAPSPLPAAPAIASVALEGVPDGEIRQGAAGTLVVEGTNLDRVTFARLGELDIHVPPGAATATTLRLPFAIPHGQPPGPLALALRNAGGSATHGLAVRVTPFVVSATGSDAGRGTFASPMRLCRSDRWVSILRYGDILFLRDGVHACDEGVFLTRGVTVRGESRAGARIQALAQRPFRGFSSSSGHVGTTTIERLTIESIDLYGIWQHLGVALAVNDLDIKAVTSSGIRIDNGTATIERYTFTQSAATAIVIGGGSVVARHVTVDGAYKGALVGEGTLDLADSTLATTNSAVESGDLNSTSGTRRVTVARSTLRSRGTVVSGGNASIAIADSTLEGLVPDTHGLWLSSGTLAMSRTTMRGSAFGIRLETLAILFTPHLATYPIHAAIDSSEIEGGIHYSASPYTGTLRLRDTQLTGSFGVLSVYGTPTSVDLGTPDSPGHNKLVAVDGGPALEDVRTGVGVAIDAYGNTLNGVSYTGDVLGPAATAGYRITAANTIHF